MEALPKRRPALASPAKRRERKALASAKQQNHQRVVLRTQDEDNEEDQVVVLPELRPSTPPKLMKTREKQNPHGTHEVSPLTAARAMRPEARDSKPRNYHRRQVDLKFRPEPTF